MQFETKIVMNIYQINGIILCQTKMTEIPGINRNILIIGNTFPEM